MITSKLYNDETIKFYVLMISLIVGTIVGFLTAQPFIDFNSRCNSSYCYDRAKDSYDRAEDMFAWFFPCVMVGLLIIIPSIFFLTNDYDSLFGFISFPIYIFSLFMGHWLYTSSGIFSFPLWLILGICFIVIEILFWKDKKEPKYESNFWFAVKRKLFAICDVLLGLFAANIIYWIVQLVILLIQAICDNVPIVIEVLKWTGIIALAILGILAYFAINSLKYRRNKK